MQTDSENEIERVRVLLRERIEEVRRGKFETLRMTELALVQTDSEILRAELEVPAIMILSHLEGHGLAADMLEDVNERLSRVPTEAVDVEIAWHRLNYAGMLLIGLSQNRQAQARLNEGLGVVAGSGRADWESGLLLTRARSYLDDGETIASARDLAKVVSLDASPIIVGSANSQLADLFESFGQDAHAMDHRSRSLDWELDPNGKFSSIFAQFTVLAPLMHSEIEVGDYKGAQVTRDLCDRLLQSTDSKLIRSILTHLEAVLLIRTGRPEDGLAVLDNEDDGLAASGHLVSNLCIPLARAEALIALDRYDDGIAVIDTALDDGAAIAHQQRLCQLAIRSHQAVGDWESVVSYQQRLVEVMRQRRVESRELHALHTEHARSRSQRHATEGLAQTNQSLDITRSDRDALLDVVTHDVMSPLSSLKLLLDSMAMTEDPGDTTASSNQRFRTAERFTTTLRRVEKIVNQLTVLGGTFEGAVDRSGPPSISTSVRTTASTTASAATALATNHVDVDELVAEIVESHRALADQKLIDLVLEAEETLPVVGGPSESISHIVQNLLSNAIKFSDPGSTVCVRLLRRKGRRAGERGVSVLVVDQGPGLVGADLDRLFTRYGQLSARPTAGETSTGLGLYIADRFAKALGAELSASSLGASKGSTFRLDLPTLVIGEFAGSRVGQHLVATTGQ